MALEKVRIQWRAIKLWTKPTAELDARVEELGSLKDQIQAVGISIAEAVSGGGVPCYSEH
jgi:hypothetical protein